MFIRDRESAQVALSTLEAGAVFLYIKRVFILTDEIDEDKNLRVVDLEDGMLGTLKPEQEVSPLPSAALVKYEGIG